MTIGVCGDHLVTILRLSPPVTDRRESPTKDLAEVARQLEVTEATYHGWPNQSV